MIDYETLKPLLAQSRFRSRFRLGEKERRYVAEKGMAQISAQAEKIIRERLAAAYPLNDGQQTPMRGHAVFIAQHATGSCCRGCLEKWQHIPRFSPLTEEEIQAVIKVICAWISDQCADFPAVDYTPDLF